MNYNWLDNFKGVKVDFTPDFSDYGYWAFLDNEGMLVIGEERGCDGGQLYRGPWKGENTPYLSENTNMKNIFERNEGVGAE